MKRGRGLSADPARAAERRARREARRMADGPRPEDLAREKRRAATDTPRSQPRALPGQRDWTQAVFALYGHRCIVCGRRATEAHHTVPRQVILAARHLSREEREALAYDPRQGVPIDRDCHAAHEGGSRRIPFSRLPDDVVRWAIEHGFRGRIMDERIYPRRSS